MLFNSFESAFARELAKRVNEVVQETAVTLVQGGANVEGDPAKTAMKYAETIGYARALAHVIEWCRDVEDELTGRAAARVKKQKEEMTA